MIDSKAGKSTKRRTVRRIGTHARRVCVAAAVAVAVAGTAVAQRGTPAEPLPPAFMVQRGAISLQQATAIALRRYQGRVVRAEPTQRGDRIVYEIRILGEDGRVRTVRIDAQTGQFL